MEGNRNNGSGSIAELRKNSGKWSKYTQAKAKGDASWAKVDISSVFAALVAVTNAGNAILFSKTRDGGALVITLCEGDERAKFYSSTKEECEEQLSIIADNA